MSTSGEVHGTASYKTNLLRPDSVAAMTEQYKQIIAGLAANLDGPAGVTG